MLQIMSGSLCKAHKKEPCAGSECAGLTCDLLPLGISSFGTLKAGSLRCIFPFCSCGMCILQASPGAGSPGQWKSWSCWPFSRTLVCGQSGLFSVRQHHLIIWGCAQTVHKAVLMYLCRSSNAVEKRLQVIIMKWTWKFYQKIKAVHCI